MTTVSRTNSLSYSESHPWITFQLNLSDAGYRLWVMLGEAKAMCDQVAGVPLQPAVAEQLHGVFLAKGARATTAIEGNTLSEEEVMKRISGKLPLPPSKEYLGKEIDNIVRAYNVIMGKVRKRESLTLSVENIKYFNNMILDQLPLSDDVIPGEIRTSSVGVGRYIGAPAGECEYLLNEMCDWLNQRMTIPEGMEKEFGIIRAILAHLYVAWIHPFGDGNGRTARLIEFQILVSVGVPSTAAHLLSNHYNQTRTEYYRQLEYASQSGGDALPFIRYSLQGFLDGLKDQINYIEEQQLMVHWINYIYEVFSDKNKNADNRRRQLILELSGSSQPFSISEIRHATPRIAEMYANLSQKTVERDIQELQHQELLIKEGKRYRIHLELMLAFMPVVHSESEG